MHPFMHTLPISHIDLQQLASYGIRDNVELGCRVSRVPTSPTRDMVYAPDRPPPLCDGLQRGQRQVSRVREERGACLPASARLFIILKCSIHMRGAAEPPHYFRGRGWVRLWPVPGRHQTAPRELFVNKFKSVFSP